MIDQTRARELAEKALPEDDVALGPARELREGWFFPFVGGTSVGSQGVIVNKATGRPFQLGSAFPVERDLAMYDRGYQADEYDLVIVAVHDLEATVRVILKLGPTEVEVTEEGGTVWRVAKAIPAREIRRRLGRLPCMFRGMRLYLTLELLEEAKAGRWFGFEVRPQGVEAE